MIMPGPARRSNEVAFSDFERLALDDEPRAMAFENESNGARHVAVRQRVFARFEHLQIQNQSPRRAVFERGVPQLNDAAERDVEADDVAGFFHSGEKVSAFPKARFEGRHRLAIDIALRILPVAFEVLALELLFESFERFGHGVTLPGLVESYLARFL